MSDDQQVTKNDPKVLYINLTIRDASAAVKHKVSKKLENPLVPEAVRNHAAHIASEMTTPEHVARGISRNICRQLPKKMLKHGVKVKLRQVLREGAFVVLQLRIVHVDSVALTKKSKQGGDTLLSSMMGVFLSIIGTGNQKKFEEDYLPKMVMSRLASEMPAILEEKMASKMLEAESRVLREKEQAKFILAKLKAVREEAEERRLSRVRRKRISRSRDGSFESQETNVTAHCSIGHVF